MERQRAGSFGFTFIEVLVSVAVIAIIATFSVVVFKNYYDHAALTVAEEEVYMKLRDARGDTLGSEGDSVFGVRVSSTSVTRFTGTAYSPSGTENMVYMFERGVTATGTLVTGNVDIVFSRLTGEPSASGTISLRSLDGNATRTVVIHGSGLVE